MPGFDGTGPVGEGPGTGRGFGPCVGNRPRLGGFRGSGYGRGIGRGAGGGPGRGACRWWAGDPVPYYGPAWSGTDDEKAYLKDQTEQLKAELAKMEKRMADLEQS